MLGDERVRTDGRSTVVSREEYERINVRNGQTLINQTEYLDIFYL